LAVPIGAKCIVRDVGSWIADVTNGVGGGNRGRSVAGGGKQPVVVTVAALRSGLTVSRLVPLVLAGQEPLRLSCA